MVPGRCPPRQSGSEPALQCLRPINQGLLRQKPKSHLDQLGNIKPSTASLARIAAIPIRQAFETPRPDESMTAWAFRDLFGYCDHASGFAQNTWEVEI